MLADPARGPDAIHKAVREAESPDGDKIGLPEIQDAYDLCGADLPLPKELIQGLLHRGSKLSLGGASKSYKTWTLDYMALAVAYELPWLGCATRQAKVLLVNLEIQPAFARKRLCVLADTLDIDQEPGRLDIWNLRGYATSHQEIFPRIIERIGAGGYGLVILDPIYKLYAPGDNENGASEIAALMNSVESLAVKTGAAVAFGAHYSKGNQSSERVDRSSERLRRLRPRPGQPVELHHPPGARLLQRGSDPAELSADGPVCGSMGIPAVQP